MRCHTHLGDPRGGPRVLWPKDTKGLHCWPGKRGHWPWLHVPCPTLSQGHQTGRAEPSLPLTASGPHSEVPGDGSPSPAGPPPAPPASCCSQAAPVISREHTQEVRPGRAHPDPDLRGTEHKKPPFLGREEPPWPQRPPRSPRCRLQCSGQAGRPREGGRWAAGPGTGQGRAGGHGQASAQAASGPGTARKSSGCQCLGNDKPPLGRPPRTQGQRSRTPRPCGAPGSCSWCGFWCWRLAAPSTSTGPAAGCAWSGSPRRPSPSCSECTSPSSPPVTGTGPAAPTGPCTGLPTAAAPGRPPPGLAMPAAPAGREAVGSPGPVQQPYASRHVGTEGAVSGPAAAAALRDGGVTPVRQTWMSAALAGPAAPSAVSTLPEATGASAGRGTVPLRTGGSACPGEGPPARPQAHRQGLEDTGRASLVMGHYYFRYALCHFKLVPALPTHSAPHVPPGADGAVREEVRQLRARVDTLEQKLQLALAPLHSLASLASEHGLPDPGRLLVHSFRQLDRVDSLSEQISFLEEQLGSCSCRKEL